MPESNVQIYSSTTVNSYIRNVRRSAKARGRRCMGVNAEVIYTRGRDWVPKGHSPLNRVGAVAWVRFR